MLKSGEENDLRKAKPAISLFALTAMHNRKIDLGDNGVAELAISPDFKRRLAIFAVSKVGQTPVATWLFKTGLPISDYCEPDVAPLERMPFIGDFKVTDNLKLAHI